jgi:hypothetical protein
MALDQQNWERLLPDSPVWLLPNSPVWMLPNSPVWRGSERWGDEPH